MGQTTSAPADPPRRTTRRRLTAPRLLVVGALLLGGLGLAGVERPQPVAASGPAHPTLVNPLPANTTPHVTNGDVKTVAVAGDTVVLGGNFTASTDPDGTPVNRSYLLAFDRSTGRIRRDWAPQLDNEVFSVVAAPDGQSVYVGGRFNRVDGLSQLKVARISIADGRPLPFKSGVNAVVTAMALSGDRLYIGGVFGNVQGRTRRVAALDAQTGTVDDDVDVPFAGTHRGGEGKIWRIEASPDGQHVVVVGNFATVGGQPRNQVVKLDVNGDGPVTLSPWSTTAFAGYCASFTDYVRDVSYSPDGSYFIVVTTGAKGTGLNGQCDAVSRWADSTTAGATPQWINYSGGDSHYSVEATGAAVYVGGHFRWSNNPYGTDSLGPGGVGTEGISALDPSNGLPLSWNPGRDRGQAVWQMVATPDGLYVASDTDRIGRWYYHGRIAFFPLAGGLPVPQPERAGLPVQLDQYAPAGGGNPARITTRGYDGSTLAAPTAAVADASALSGARAAFVAGGVLYTAHSDGTLRARSYDGTTLGAPVTVNLQRMTTFASDLERMNGAVYDDGRLFYTVSGSSTLYMRYFSTENRVVGAVRFDVSGSGGGVSYSQVGGMVLAGPHVYYVDRQAGTLVRATWRPGGGIDGATRTTVSPANANGLSWTGTVLFARPGQVSNQPPTAAVAASCTGLRCDFDASGSTDADGVITGVSWTFAPGQTGTGTTTSHTFAEPGTYTVSATITDDDGATAIGTRTVTVTDLPPTAAFTAQCDQGACSVDGSGSDDPDGDVESYAWAFGDGGTATGETAVHSYDESGTYTITLTITGGRGRTATATRQVTVTVPAGQGFVGVSGTTAQTTALTHQATVPADVQPGDQLLLTVASNAAGTATVTPPSGWSVVASGGTAGARVAVFGKVAAAGDAGRAVAVRLGTAAKASVGVAAYRGLAVVTPAPAVATGYRTPTTTAVLGEWVVSFWADKSATTADLAPPAGVTERRSFIGTGAGHVADLLADSAGPVAAGPVGGLAATPTSAVGNAMALTIRLAPTP
ncbi:MAG TPA: PKD domain-containing protein [Acidimicrobiales bacterium]|nr:PKD domain-containing protein [Acidimicrobiales bacterium]